LLLRVEHGFRVEVHVHERRVREEFKGDSRVRLGAVGTKDYGRRAEQIGEACGVPGNVGANNGSAESSARGVGPMVSGQADLGIMADNAHCDGGSFCGARERHLDKLT
jgi:hypothetical protein